MITQLLTFVDYTQRKPKDNLNKKVKKEKAGLKI